jgi:pimeloyl-ACP methyl ester carboxylesterase
VSGTGPGGWEPGPGFLDVGDVRLEVRRFGPPPPDAPTIVFLHEGLGSAGLWRDYPERLCARLGWGGLAYSRAGYGASDPAPLPRPLSFMHEEGWRTLPSLLDLAGIDRPVLYGHSDGASIALLFAARRPHAVRALVLEAPHSFVEDVTVESISRLERDFSDAALAEKFARWHARPEHTVLGWTRAWLDPAFRSWDIRGELAGVLAPVLVLQGEEDEYGTWAQVEAVEAGVAGPVRTRRLPACGHTPHLDRPEEAMDAAADFLRACADGA